MKAICMKGAVIALCLGAGFRPVEAQIASVQTKIRVIDMIPNAQSNETGQDSEPNIAVDPLDVNKMVGSAFTLNPTGATSTAPIFVSTDKGATWTLNNIVPSGNGMTGDISLKFGTRGHVLYTGILRGGSSLTMNILRSSNPFGGVTMTQLLSRSNEDQPFVNALTSIVSGSERDRVFVGNNNLGASGGKTATVDHSANARTAAAPAGFSNDVVEVRSTNGQDRPSVRCAAHSDGTVYALFARTTASSGSNRTCDVTVVRDDNFATAASPFTALTSGGVAGVLVATGVNMPFINSAGALGQNRLGCHMSVAVDPGNSSTVYISWTDRVGASGTRLHIRRSTNKGVSWSADLLTITDAFNPAITVNSSGTAGFLYQQLASGNWETHFRRSSNGTTWSDVTLSRTPDNNPVPQFQPYIGDYCDLMSVGKNFYGVFSASNIPNTANFPAGVKFQRNVNLATNQLRNLNNNGNVNVSIDPFFFAVEQFSIFSTCQLNPNLCTAIDYFPGRIKLKCLEEPCIRVDYIPKNCLVKFDCPGCGTTVLCPPYYHIFIDKIDPKQWAIKLVDKGGEEIRCEMNPTGDGVVLSFRPEKQRFIEKKIGDYYIMFEGTNLKGKKDFDFTTHLEVSDYRYKEHQSLGRK